MRSRDSRCLNVCQRIRTPTVMSLSVLLLSGTFNCCSAQDNLQPANEQASARAQRVLDHLKHSQPVRRNEPEHLKRLYNHELVITRDELPDWKQHLKSRRTTK